jgi:GntR family transcriptional regulator
MLGVSRGTLRTALQRLEATGEIVRRQGSGTFVGRVAAPGALDEGLERLESYSSLARRRGLRLSTRELAIARRPVGPVVAEALGIEPEAEATSVSRVVLADGEPAAFMVDTVHPDVELARDDRLARALEPGAMVLDVLLAAGVPVAFAHTRVLPRLLVPDEPTGKALGIAEPTAALELEEVMHTSSGAAVQYSRDLFVPQGIDLHVMRRLGSDGPPPVSLAADGPAGRLSAGR